jgi:HAE1 family hydrophobic/amphiphilic exporter-1
MRLIEQSIKDPVSVIVGVLLISLFGLIALFRFPIQLTPNVDIPVITVRTLWPDASSKEIEEEIVRRQEEKLKNVQGLKKLTSSSRRNLAEVTLEFEVGTNLDRARLDVSDMLRQVEDYPDQAKEPVIQSSEQNEGNKIAWLILSPERDDVFVPYQREFVEDFVVPRLRRVPGVANIDAFGGEERQVQVKVDFAALAVRGLTLGNLRSALQRENINATAGDIAEGKTDYSIRTPGQFERLDEVENVVIAYQAGGPVRVGDIAKAVFDYKEPEFRVRHEGQTVMALGVSREVDTNVIEVMAGIRQAIAEMNRDLLKPRGLNLEMVYDETDYIYSAIGLVKSNLVLGGLLAVLVLLVFLQAGRPTLVVAVSIPISVIGTFLALSLMGRNLNVISLAGMAFAVGMVVDNAIVVLENIYRHRQMGEPSFEAAYNGAVEVWGAVLASTLTTVAVFLPVVFIKQEAGQLFRDIALAISAGVLLSLLVSITVIPMLSARLLARSESLSFNRVLNKFQYIGQHAMSGILHLLNSILLSPRLKMVTIVVLIGGSLVGSWLLMPPASYLPEGNRNLVFGYMILPPGYSVDEGVRIGQQIEGVLKPYWEVKAGTEAARKLEYPPLKNFFYVSLGNISFMGLTAQIDQDVKGIIPLAESAYRSVPGVLGFVSQPSLFGRSIGGRGNTVDVEISGYDIDQVTQAGTAMFGRIMGTKGLGFPMPQPANFMLGAPEFQLRPDRVKLAKAGISWDEVILAGAAAVDGMKVGEFSDHGKKIDLVLRGPKSGLEHTQDILQVPIRTRTGIVPLGSLVESVDTTAQEEIDHIEERRAVTLSVRVPGNMALEQVMQIINTSVIAPMRASGELPPDLDVNLAGTADKLVNTGKALAGGFLLALAITYLLMSSLLGSFVHPLIIILSVPLGAVGGFGGLRLLHTLAGQQMDVLTMLGFVILIGTVVNNAILIVYQAINFINSGSEMRNALIESVRTRLRPIFMTTLTTVVGMMPLVIRPGSGSELYRGLGAVIVGGLSLSTIFTIFLIPAIFSLVPIRWISRQEPRQAGADVEPPVEIGNLVEKY